MEALLKAAVKVVGAGAVDAIAVANEVCGIGRSTVNTALREGEKVGNALNRSVIPIAPRKRRRRSRYQRRRY